VAAFRADHPKVSFDIQTLHHADIPRVLQERHCDIAIAYENRATRAQYQEIAAASWCCSIARRAPQGARRD